MKTAPNATQIRVLYVLDEGGDPSWPRLASTVRDRSGRTIRPNTATRSVMLSRGWIEIVEGYRVRITPSGREVLGVWEPR